MNPSAIRTAFAVIASAHLLLLASATAVAQHQSTADLKRAIPQDVYLVTHRQHNPERDFQRLHFAKVWQTFQETKLTEKVAKIIADSAPQEGLDQVRSVFDELRQAATPIDLEAFSKLEVEVFYTQRMQGFTNQQLCLLRLGSEAENWEAALINLMQLANKYSKGRVPVEMHEHEGVTITVLSVPPEAQFVPTLARVDDVLFLANSVTFLEQSISQLLDPDAKGKFETPRVKEALEQLPTPEDSFAFYDGRLHFEQMRSMGDAIRQQSGGNPGAERAAGILEDLFKELSLLDYECTVEFTEGNQNRTQAYGKLLPDIQDKMFYKAFAGNGPISDWQTWVPAEALSYSVQSGMDLHPIYEGLMALVRKHFPESEDSLRRFADLQKRLGIDLDADILQSFSGELVSITLPSAKASFMASPDSVMAMRCTNPERIRELLHRGIEAIGQHPAAQFQQFKVVPSERLEGFEELSAIVLNAFGARPTFGFQDGWMLIGSNASAIERVLAVRSGNAESVIHTEKFKQLAPEFSSPVYSITYSNLGENIRAVSKALGQGGAIAQMAIGLAGMQADAEELKPLQQALGLLPDVAKVVASFDFLEEQISVTQAIENSDASTYVRKSVIQVRPLEPDSALEADQPLKQDSSP